MQKFPSHETPLLLCPSTNLSIEHYQKVRKDCITYVVHLWNGIEQSLSDVVHRYRRLRKDRSERLHRYDYLQLTTWHTQGEILERMCVWHSYEIRCVDILVELYGRKKCETWCQASYKLRSTNVIRTKSHVIFWSLISILHDLLCFDKCSLTGLVSIRRVVK